MNAYYTEGDKYLQSFGITVSNPGDNDRGLAVFFMRRKTTETAAESDDNIMSHPSRFSTYTFPAWKQASTGMVEDKVVSNWFSAFLYVGHISTTLLDDINLEWG